MNWQEQGTIDTDRHTVVPRTLTFLTCRGQVLLLRGAPNKRIWPGKLNGVGGHLEPGEDALTGARREVREETGIDVDALTLRAVVHISGPAGDAGVMMLVFVGAVQTMDVSPNDEGEAVWYPIGGWLAEDLVDDLPELLPRVLDVRRGMTFGCYDPDPATGRMRMCFLDGDVSG